MKNRKLSSKAVISLILSAVLFTMPAVAFSVNGNYAISAFAEETKETEESKPEESTEQTPGESETDVSTEENTENSTEGSTEETTEGSTEGSTEGGTEENTEGSTDESTGDGTVSGNDKPEPVCNCEDQCGAYEYDKNCPVCVTDYKLCTYKKPNVSIKIRQPEEWHNDIVSVSLNHIFALQAVSFRPDGLWLGEFFHFVAFGESQRRQHRELVRIWKFDGEHPFRLDKRITL